jgi:molecular chaperone GrpE
MSDNTQNPAENAEMNDKQEQNAEPQINLNADDNAAGTSGLSEPLEDEDTVNKLLDELSELKDKYLRLTAEFDNYKKRTAKEMYELRQTAGKDIIIGMLEVADNCDRAEQQAQTSNEVLPQGVQLTFQQLRTFLTQKGVVAIESKRLDFDVELHEAITEIPAPTPELVGKVVDEVQKGYTMNDKLIRFAKVVVGKAAE